jgi:hypothetical protein
VFAPVRAVAALPPRVRLSAKRSAGGRSA